MSLEGGQTDVADSAEGVNRDLGVELSVCSPGPHALTSNPDLQCEVAVLSIMLLEIQSHMCFHCNHKTPKCLNIVIKIDDPCSTSARNAPIVLHIA